jgi:hypothetical protein
LVFGLSSSVDSARRESLANNTIIGHAFTQYLLKQAIKRFSKEAQALRRLGYLLNTNSQIVFEGNTLLLLDKIKM